jgi:hypothetical protein
LYSNVVDKLVDEMTLVYYKNYMTMAGYSEIAFQATVARNQNVAAAPTYEHRVRLGESALAVRRRGSFVTGCTLRRPSDGQLVDILACGSDISVPKLRASHPMMPVGPHDGPGGQHGALRWLDFKEAGRDEKEGEARLALTAPTPDTAPFVTRSFVLRPSMLTTITSVLAARRPLKTSLGHHDYYPLPDGDCSGVRINGQPLDDLLDEKGATEAIMGGEARYWGGFTGNAQADFPGGLSIGITAEILSRPGGSYTRAEPIRAPLGMLIWHQPDSEHICLEPTIGVNHHGTDQPNDGLQVPALGNVSLMVKTQLL